MKPQILDVLAEIAKRKGRTETKTTTSVLAKKLDSSQQTISRKIRELEGLGFIERISFPRGQKITVTEKGYNFLRREYSKLKEVIEYSDKTGVSFGGYLISGSGEGKYYISQDRYFLQFNDKLGFRPFLGTLNLRLKSLHDMKTRNDFEKTAPLVIKGFEKDKRSFGDLKCYQCRINRRFKGAVVIPDRTHHPSDIIEVISPVFLRKELSLKDGDYIHIEVNE
jgi:riboflavin kinase